MFVIDEFEKAVVKYPNNIALKLEDGRQITYTKLNDVANTISNILYNNQIVNNNNDNKIDVKTPTVCVMFDRDVGFFASILGILKIECAYVPVDPSFPPDRQSYIFYHSKCELLIADQDSYNQAVKLGVNISSCIIVDTKTGNIIEYINIKQLIEINSTRIDNRIRENNVNSLAYILYTSGSTGKPKGVMVKQVGVTNVVKWFTNELNVDCQKVILGLTTFCFDISVLEYFLALTNGATLVVVNSSTQKDPQRILDIINESGVNIFQATPTTYEMLLIFGWNGDASIDMLVGGEAFRPKLLKLVDNCRSLRNVYGPTETTIWSSSYNLKQTSSIIDTKMAIPIGQPISETIFYIVDINSLDSNIQSWKQVPKCREGELWIGGIGVAAGYIHAPEITKEKFIQNPFGDGILYRTGDIVKESETDSNVFYFVRRLDDQVKIGGFRIELQEIESVYSEHPLLEQAVALVRNDKLLIYIKSHDDKKLSTQELDNIKDFVSKKLTYYMIPKFTCQIENFPKTPNGKLDKKLFPDPSGWNDFTVTINHVENDIKVRYEKSTISSILCSMIATTRGIQLTGSSSFASIGIDSLGAVLFLREVSYKFGGMRIDPKALYSAGVTIKSFARTLYKQLKDHNPDLLKNLSLSEESDDVEDDNTLLPSDIYSSFFQKAILSNIRLIEGARGVFAFMVLWEHVFVGWARNNFNNPWTTTTLLGADTFCFFVISGFITSIQLYEAPQFSSDSGTATLKPRGSFKWKSFIYTRILGLFPIYWCALLLMIPWWKGEEDKFANKYLSHPDNNSINWCRFASVIAQAIWLNSDECWAFDWFFLLVLLLIVLQCMLSSE